ncbi:hypothetical protein ANN_17190 [Periplaneta americana]|uniref:Uncharacterized protein n=1 Tax=Periplaneta americana TaxID=6978 RepID=A0ABQ8SUC2_PERAM|nr:hypothetical protein ANN_17190 [Periplaneta americana]
MECSRLIYAKTTWDPRIGKSSRRRSKISLSDVFRREMRAQWTTARDRKELVGSLAEKKLSPEGCTEGMENRRRVRDRRRNRMIDDIKMYGSYVETKSKAENRKHWRMLGLQSKTCPWAENYEGMNENIDNCDTMLCAKFEASELHSV